VITFGKTFVPAVVAIAVLYCKVYAHAEHWPFRPFANVCLHPALAKALGQARERPVVAAFAHGSSPGLLLPRVSKRLGWNLEACNTLDFHFV
jgi:hypothetical protein